MVAKFMQIKYLQSQCKRKVWCSTSKTKPLLLALVVKKVKHDGPDLNNYMPKFSTNKEKRAGNFSPLTNSLVMAVMSKSVRLIVTKGKIKPFMEVA